MIIKLDERISNMIAAGEVVTRPSNALKEIVENAIDAKATAISVDILGYGLQEIKVSDNGIGMNETDLKMAFHRHATSKIKTEYDLNHIFTLGFRGEAIPAIASVSKLTIRSNNGSIGSEVYYEGGRFVHQKIVPLNQGTEVLIDSLFYNVPARLKHIKNPQTELSHMLEVCDAFILSNPHIAFKVTHDGKVLRQSYGKTDYATLFQSVFGKNTHIDMITTKKEKDYITIFAYLGSPKITKARKNDIIVILNGRVIKNYSLIQAVIEGYHTRLMTNRYPIAVIDISMDISLVDVNIHPQKKEVKISNEYVLANLVRQTVKEAFITKKETIYEQPNYTQISGFEYVKEALELEINEEPVSTYEEKLPEFDYIGQYSGTYLLFQNEIGLYLIDQHAAAERIRYEVYYDKLGVKGYTKPLLFPILLELRPTEENVLKEHMEGLKELGFTLELAGPTGLFLNEVPIWLVDEDMDALIQMIIVSLDTYGEVNLKDLRDNLSKSIACSGAIKANKYLNQDEVNHLMNELRKTKNPYYCPHGRPILIMFSDYDIQKRFKRIV